MIVDYANVLTEVIMNGVADKNFVLRLKSQMRMGVSIHPLHNRFTIHRVVSATY